MHFAKVGGAVFFAEVRFDIGCDFFRGGWFFREVHFLLRVRAVFREVCFVERCIVFCRGAF